MSPQGELSLLGMIRAEPVDATQAEVMACKTLTEAMQVARMWGRRNRGLYNRDVADLLGMSPSYLTEIVTGAKSVPEDWRGGKDFLAAFSRATGLRIAQQWQELDEARRQAEGPHSRRERVEQLARRIHPSGASRTRVLEEASDAAGLREVVVQQAIRIAELEAQIAAVARLGLIDRRAS